MAMRMNVQGWLGADNPLAKYRRAREGPTDEIELLDKSPVNVTSKAHCKFYYLVSLSIPSISLPPCLCSLAGRVNCA
jgi:hypothetical protein